MANIINRAAYGNLNCAWAVFKSRYTNPGVTIKSADLKYSAEKMVNSIDICEGSLIAQEKAPLSPAIVKDQGRTRYCPYIKIRTGDNVCQWVQSSSKGTKDTQKSKASSQVPIIFDILDLIKPHYTKNGTLNGIEWTAKAHEVSSYEWGSKELEEHMTKCIQGYGPFLALTYYLHRHKSDEISSEEVSAYLYIRPSEEEVLVTCPDGIQKRLKNWDGNTSQDAGSRTTSTLLDLAASMGFLRPAMYPPTLSLNPFTVSKWMSEQEMEKKDETKKEENPHKKQKKSKIKYHIEREKLNCFFENTPTLEKGIDYFHLVPKARSRGGQERCDRCGKNWINMAKLQYSHISQNRRLLLLEALKYASQKGKAVDLKKLTEISGRYPEFHFNRDNQLNVFLNIERVNATFFGIPNRLLDGEKLIPLVKVREDAYLKSGTHIDTMIANIVTNDILC